MGRRVRRPLRHPDGPRPRARRIARGPVQHGRHGLAPGRLQQRCVQAARQGEPAHLPDGLARRPRRGAPDQVDHQRHPRPHLGLARGPGDVRPPRTTRMARRRRGPVGTDRRRQRRRAVAGPPAGQGAPDRVRPPAPPRLGAGQGHVRGRVRVGRRRLRPCVPHHRLRPTVRAVQAGNAAALPAPPPGRAPEVHRPAPPARSSPARPTPPTTPARR